jgi:hypothetical protein
VVYGAAAKLTKGHGPGIIFQKGFDTNSVFDGLCQWLFVIVKKTVDIGLVDAARKIDAYI